MRLVAHTVRVPLLALLLLGLGSAEAQAHDFSVSPDPPNEDGTTTFQLLESEPIEDVRWDLDNDGFDDGTAGTATYTYADRGPVTVRMEVTDADGTTTVTKDITVNGAPAVDFESAPANPMTGQDVAFSSDVTDLEGDNVTLSWDFGDGETATGAAPAHAYDVAGSYVVELTATDEHGAVAGKTSSVSVTQDPGPAAGFVFAPAAPVTGESVTFTSTSTPSQGSITDLAWDLDGDGDFDDAHGPTATRSYASPGSRVVLLQVTQANGLRSVAFANVEVVEAPLLGSGGEPPGPVPMRPFPIVRISGAILPRGVLVRVLSVRAPRGARVRVRCRGRSCPARAVARTSATRVLRFHRFERRLHAGVRLEIFVRQAGMIGKYTRFLIRAGKPPARVDRCLLPGRKRPVSCG